MGPSPDPGRPRGPIVALPHPKSQPRTTNRLTPACTSELAKLPGKSQSMNGLLDPSPNKQRNSQHWEPPPGWPP